MIEEIIIRYLTEKHWDVFAEKPDTPPREYALIAKVGGDMTNHIRRATVDIQVYSDSTYNASSLNELMIADMLGFDDASVSDHSLISEMIFNDLDNGIYSYQTTWEFYYY